MHISFRARRASRSVAAGFTLIEILIVVAIIGILAALLFPAFKSARERGNQTSCVSNLHQISLAVQLYRNDEKRFPASLAFLLPSEMSLSEPTATATELPPATKPNADGTGYIKSQDVLLCPDDELDSEPRSSYGDISWAPQNPPTAILEPAYYSRNLWNFYGYKADGTAYQTVTAPTDLTLLVDKDAPFDIRRNPIKYSLSNRYAPGETIITHCVFHRTQTSKMSAPNDATILAGARDIVLRLDGAAKSVDISNYGMSGWQKQGAVQ